MPPQDRPFRTGETLKYFALPLGVCLAFYGALYLGTAIYRKINGIQPTPPVPAPALKSEIKPTAAPTATQKAEINPVDCITTNGSTLLPNHGNVTVFINGQSFSPNTPIEVCGNEVSP